MSASAGRTEGALSGVGLFSIAYIAGAFFFVGWVSFVGVFGVG